MRRDSRRQFLQCSLALVGISLLSGCEKAPSPSKVPRIGFLAVGSRGNITGMTLVSSQLGGKRLDLLKVIVPDLAQVAVFWNSSNPTYGPVLKELEAAAPALGLKLQRLEVRVPGDLEGAFKTATRQRVGALIAPGDPLVANRPKVA